MVPRALFTALASLLVVVVFAGGLGAFLLTRNDSAGVSASLERGSDTTNQDTDDDSTETEIVVDIPQFFDELAEPESNLALLSVVLEDVGAGTGTVPTSEVLDALEARGFPSAMTSYTNPATQIEFPADSISVAVDVGEVCLIGQYSTTWISTSVQPELENGECLLGDVLTPSE